MKRNDTDAEWYRNDTDAESNRLNIKTANVIRYHTFKKVEKSMLRRDMEDIFKPPLPMNLYKCKKKKSKMKNTLGRINRLETVKKRNEFEDSNFIN